MIVMEEAAEPRFWDHYVQFHMKGDRRASRQKSDEVSLLFENILAAEPQSRRAAEPQSRRAAEPPRFIVRKDD